MYKVDIKTSASKNLSKLPKSAQKYLAKTIDKLANNPRCHGTEKMTGYENLYKHRTSNWRIVFSIFDKELTILVFHIGDRKDIYKHNL